MGTGHREGAGIGWEDISSFVREYSRETGSTVVLVYYPHGGPGDEAYWEAQLRANGQPLSVPASVIRRVPGTVKRRPVALSALLHAVAQCYADLEREPWLWASDARARARGEGLPGE